MSSTWSRTEQVETLVFLVSSQHPIRFRVSFSRVVIAVSVCADVCVYDRIGVCSVSQRGVRLQVFLQADRRHESDSATMRALCSSVFDLYKECAELRHVESSPSSKDVVGVASIRRVATALKVLLESSATLRHLVVVKRGVHFCSGAIKESLHAVRMEGGFGGKTRHPREDLLTSLCERAAIHFDVLSALVGGDPEAQAIALVSRVFLDSLLRMRILRCGYTTDSLCSRSGLTTAPLVVVSQRERVGDVVSGNWTTMRMASHRGSSVLHAALRFSNNFAFANDATKASFVVGGTASGSLLSDTAAESGPERPSTLFALLVQLVIPRESGATTPAARGAKTRTMLSASASGILKSLVANSECLLWAIKSGFVPKLLDDVQRRLRAVSQTSKSDPVEVTTLCDLLGVLASVASSDEGRQAVYSSAETTLVYILEDILQSSEANAEVLKHGSLFVRNLSLSRLSRSYLAVWEPSLDLVLKRLLPLLVVLLGPSNGEDERRDGGDLDTSSEVARYLSCTLWSVVFENQKARTLLLSRPSVVRKLEEHCIAVRTAVAAGGCNPGWAVCSRCVAVVGALTLFVGTSLCWPQELLHRGLERARLQRTSSARFCSSSRAAHKAAS